MSGDELSEKRLIGPGQAEVEAWVRPLWGDIKLDLKAGSFKTLEESIELCLATGATSEEITNETEKVLRHQKKTLLLNEEDVKKELADIGITTRTFAAGANWSEEQLVLWRMETIKARRWRTLDTGILVREK